MLTLAVLTIFLAGFAQGKFTQGPTGPTPKPVQCSSANLDTCTTFSGYRKGNFPINGDRTAFVTCTGSKYFHCTRCPRNNIPKDNDDEYLYFSRKCNKCVRRDDLRKPCPNVPTTSEPATTRPRPQANPSFCKYQKTGLYAYPGDKSFYYACNHGYTWLMPCPAGLEFDKSCDACVRPGTTHG